MKQSSFSLSLLFSVVAALGVSLAACTRAARLPAQSDSNLAGHPHLEMEMTGRQYLAELEKNPALLEDDAAVAMKPVLELGKRNLDWLTFINQHRDTAHQISLSSKETEPAFPVEQPREYNTELVLKMYSDLLSGMPPAMANVLKSTDAFPENPTVSEADYIRWGHGADLVYQLGVRWLMAKQYLQSYIEERKNDVRGFYFLSKETDLPAKLTGWAKLDTATQKRYRDWLIGVCSNTTASLTACANELDGLIGSQGDVKGFWDKYSPASQELTNSFFKMQWQRNDIVWSAEHPELLRVPFVDPNNASVGDYLKTNIEDEWKWQNWNLRLDFQAGDPGEMSHLEYQAGVTAHVEVPNTIVMDQNQPTTEYDARWVIRHEFGHILGFPDCYVEFYDEDQAKMISYQLDISNLMCSRRGAFKQIHFDELKRVYFK